MVLYLSIFLLITNGCIIVILSWIKINIPDKIARDKWIKTLKREIEYLGLSPKYMNSEASYQT